MTSDINDFIYYVIENSGFANTNRFIIHEHLAKRAGRHFDIRFEKDGVLKSWTTRKLEFLLNDESKKISLFKTPDHNLDWLSFEGEIKDGYGAGIVKIWDSGTYKLLYWTEESKILKISGEKINGLFVIHNTKIDGQYLFFRKK